MKIPLKNSRNLCKFADGASGNKSLIFQCLPIAADALFARPQAQVLRFGGMTGLDSFTYGVLKNTILDLC